jgi:hypothetical protein
MAYIRSGQPLLRQLGIHRPQGSIYFARAQESTCKDIERAFGVLQARWAVVMGSAYGWDHDKISNILTAYIIMHNMIIEDGREFANDKNFECPSIHADPSTRSDRVQR